MSKTSERLKEVMMSRGISASKLVEICQPYCEKYNVKIDKSYISRYLKGEITPKSEKLTILALALNTNEVYLMGENVADAPRKMFFESKELKEAINLLKQLDLYDLGRITSKMEEMLEAEKYHFKKFA